MARLAEPVDSPSGKHQFRLGIGAPDGTVTLLSGRRTHFLSAASRATCLLEIPPDITRLPAGAGCALWPLD